MKLSNLFKSISSKIEKNKILRLEAEIKELTDTLIKCNEYLDYLYKLPKKEDNNKNIEDAEEGVKDIQCNINSRIRELEVLKNGTK